MRRHFIHAYEDIIFTENLLEAWREFLKGKRKRADVREFSRFLMYHISKLQNSLSQRTYTHGGYEAFRISDPKPRDIHKATVRDRLVHHAVYRQLYPLFDKTFIADSYSCRKEKGAHMAMERFRSFAYQVSKNNTRTCWVLKCDIRKFFASIDHCILKDILCTYVSDEDTLWLLGRIVDSFSAGKEGVGLPLGNLTSQLLVNVYMNEFDQFVKHKLKAKHYIRYADDFVFLSRDRGWLESLIPLIETFLSARLKLELHPKKLSIGTLAAGVDFLGWVHFFDHRVLRTSSKKRILRRIKETGGRAEILQSYLALLKDGNGYRLRKKVERLSQV